VGSQGSLLPADHLALPDFSPAQFQQLLEELRGTPVVVNVWGSWCPPCRTEAPELAAVSKTYQGRVQFVGVDILDQREPARAFIEEFGWPYPSVFDPEGDIRDALGYVGQPVTVLYDEAGDSVFVWSGAISEDILVEELDRVVES
jgi:cytochrome c biogenesis protein CcmG, thiol:disulfide interchange protein DsbE